MVPIIKTNKTKTKTQQKNMRSDIFSPDDLPDSFWSPPRETAAPSPPPPGMNRSQSEWALEKFLEEISSVCVEPLAVEVSAASGPTVSQSSSSNFERKLDEMIEIMAAHHQRPFIDQAVQIDSEQYHAYLKSQLDIACAAVALARTSSGMAGNSADLPVNDEKGSQLGCQSDAKGATTSSSRAANEGNVVHVDMPAPPVGLNAGINEADSGQLGIRSLPARQRRTSTSEADSSPVEIPALPDRQGKKGIQGRQTMSESSREDSDDDEVEGVNEIPENMDPAESKRARRMLSNRESARRSRRRKQEQMNELETQVGQLKVEHSTLFKRLTDINRKCDEAAVDNRVLKADIETLRAKVKMAEETVKRVTGINPLLLAMSKAPSFNLPFASNTVIDASANTSSQLRQNHNQFHQQPLSSIPAAVHDRVKGGLENSSKTPLANPSVDVARNRLAGMPPALNIADSQRAQNHLLQDE